MAAAEAAMHSPGSEVQGLDWGLLLSRHATCSSPNLVSDFSTPREVEVGLQVQAAAVRMQS